MFDQQKMASLRAAAQRWQDQTLKKTLDKVPERPTKFMTESSKPIERLYTPLNIESHDYEQDLGMPGEYPYTRGIHATGYRGKGWTMRMFAGFGTAEESNERYKYLLANGSMGLSIAFDLPTLMGYDTDAPEALGEFGKCGVAVSSLQDMEILLADLPLDSITTSMTINSPAAMIWAFYIAAAEKRGIPRAKLGGTLQNDILKEYSAQKEYIFPPRPSMRLVTDTIEFGTKHMPLWNTISVSGYHIREAGSTAAQELAFTLADGIEYVRWGVERGLNVDDFAQRISFFFNVHNDLFEEVAKFRAARRIWAREMKLSFGAKNPRSWLLRTHAQTAGVSLTAQQPEINLIRVAIQALAATLGGVQSLHTNSMDEALALPSEFAVTLAIRTQQILAHETGVVNTIDPLGGAYFIETLTNELEAEAYHYFQKIDALGGMIPALEVGYIQQEIADSAFTHARELDKKERVIVGVNDYVVNDPVRIPILEMDPQGYQRQVARLQALRQSRDNEKVGNALNALRHATKGSENLMTHFIDCALADCTLQEMVDVLRQEFGVYRETEVI